MPPSHHVVSIVSAKSIPSVRKNDKKVLEQLLPVSVVLQIFGDFLVFYSHICDMLLQFLRFTFNWRFSCTQIDKKKWYTVIKFRPITTNDCYRSLLFFLYPLCQQLGSVLVFALNLSSSFYYFFLYLLSHFLC